MCSNGNGLVHRKSGLKEQRRPPPLRKPSPSDGSGESLLLSSSSSSNVSSTFTQSPRSPTHVLNALRMWVYGLWSSVENCMPFLVPTVSPVSIECLQPFADHSSVPFSHENTRHSEVLNELWSAFNQRDELKGATSEQWKDYGFQGDDPATDFRGVGVFGLHNILFFSSCYPDLFQRLSSPNSQYSFPFAIAGLNITMMLLGLLNLTKRKSCFHTTHKNESARAKKARKSFVDIMLHEVHRCYEFSNEEFIRTLERVFGYVYCATFNILSAKWIAMKAGPMQFNEVLMKAKDGIQDVLIKSTTVADVTHISGLDQYN